MRKTAPPSCQRDVIDRNRLTGGGVTAGIGFSLTLAKMLCGEETAKTIQIALEYRPAPPFEGLTKRGRAGRGCAA